MIATITQHCSKGVANYDTPSIKFTWFKTNFNMPVPNYTGGTFVRYQGYVTYQPADVTSFDLSGFSPGFEICNGMTIFDFENDSGSTYNINTNATIKWVDNDNSTTIVLVWNSANLSYSLGAGLVISWSGGGHIGVAGWEIDTNANYYWKASASGTPNISEVSLPITMSNVPAVTQLGSTKPGHIWVEGNNLCYINANQWKHTIGGYFIGQPGTSKAGALWIDETDNFIHWITGNGDEFRTPWAVKQFASFYTNSSTGAVYAGTTKKGFIWVDNQFGWTHLAYIGTDGYKYLTGAGDNPYA